MNPFWRSGAAAKPPPHHPLLGPDRAAEHLAQVALGDGLAAGREAEGQDLGLDVGCEQEQVHELGDPGAGEAEATGHIGVVAELALLHPALESVGQRELAGDARGVAADSGRGLGAGARPGAGFRLEGDGDLDHDVASTVLGEAGAVLASATSAPGATTGALSPTS